MEKPPRRLPATDEQALLDSVRVSVRVCILENGELERCGQMLAAHHYLGDLSPETVALLTSLSPGELDAESWLALNRDAWGIENGLHARLDVSRRDDQCRLRSDRALWLHAMFSRLANSLFMEWRNQQPRPRHLTTTNFSAWMSADHARRAVATVTARRPSLKAEGSFVDTP